MLAYTLVHMDPHTCEHIHTYMCVQDFSKEMGNKGEKERKKGGPAFSNCGKSVLHVHFSVQQHLGHSEYTEISSYVARKTKSTGIPGKCFKRSLSRAKVDVKPPFCMGGL